MPRRDPEALQRLVRAATEMVAANGTRGATIRDIAAHAGVTTGSVMHYFADKDLLLKAVIDDNNRLAGERVQRAIRKRRGLAALRAAAEAVLPFDADRRRTWDVWIAFWMDTDATSGLTIGASALRAMFRSSLREAVDDGELPPDLDVEHEAAHLAVLMAGLGLYGGVEGASRVRPVARRILDEHFADLAGRSPHDRSLSA